MRVILLLILVVLLLIVAPFTMAQSPAVIYVFMDDDSFTIYIPSIGNISLEDIKFQAAGEFLLNELGNNLVPDFEAVPTPICLIFRQYATRPPMPEACKGVTTSIQDVLAVDLFWYDPSSGHTRAIGLMRGAESLGLCSNTSQRCEIEIPIAPLEQPIPVVPNVFELSSDIPPAGENEHLLILAAFQQLNGVTRQPAEEFANILDERMQYARDNGVNVRIARTEEVVTTREQAQQLLQDTGATMVIWGEIDQQDNRPSLRTRYEIDGREVNQTNIRINETTFTQSLSLRELDIYIREADELLYVANFTIGQLYYFDGQYDKSIDFFDEAVAYLADKTEETQRALNMAEAQYYLAYALSYEIDQPVPIPQLQRAIRAFQAALEFYERDTYSYAVTQMGLASVYARLGYQFYLAQDRATNFGYALNALVEAFRFLNADEHLLNYAEAVEMLGSTYWAMEERASGCEALRTAEPLLRSAGRTERADRLRFEIEFVCNAPPVQLLPPTSRERAIIGSQSGEIELGGSDNWTFDGREGEIITLSVRADLPANGAVDQTLLLDPLVRIYTPDGELYAVNDDINQAIITDSEISQLVLPSYGSYRIEIVSWFNLTAGAYTLTIESSAAP